MEAMKFSAADWAYYSKANPPESFYGRLRAMGYEGIEMVDPSRWRQARDAGLKILNLSGPGMEKGLNRKAHHAELIPKIKDAIATAGANGIPQVIVFSGNRDGQPDAEGIAHCRLALEALLADAEKNRVTLVFEMLNSYEHKDYQADHGAYGFELIRQIGSPALKLLYDVYHMERMGDDSARDIVAHLPTIAHLHLAESPRRDRPMPGGVINYAKIVPAVRKAGYNGYWGMEFIAGEDSLADLREAREFFLSL
jgi:hydroxypyruvate isomerase